MRTYKKETIEEYVALQRAKNSRKWFDRVYNKLKSILGEDVSTTSICSKGYHSGQVDKKKDVVRVFRYGNLKTSRCSGFSYNIYPVICIPNKLVK